MSTILYHSFVCIFACVSFSIIFNAPRHELIFCGINGFLSWFAYSICFKELGLSITVSTAIAAMCITVFARFASFHRQVPATLYHIAGIMPLVPGTAIYNTMQAAVQGHIIETYSYLLDVVKYAGGIGIGSIMILALPYGVFEVIPRRTRKFGYRKKSSAKKQ